MIPENIANKARESISDYCINECKALCCRKEHLILSKEEMELTVGKQRKPLENAGFLVEMENNQFVLNLGNPKACPNLKNYLCTIHKNPNRALTCKEFPVFITGKKVKFSDRCTAVKANKLYPYVHEFKKLGFKIE
ncbi:YkgJ family cysteine cluster protein [Candidatus Woesearchaeota archaeon]|nr:YkgJ family cysteine cluster protein [Candidatus Woesearchaeota archaeon]